jgi:hypothetical protein
VATRRDSSHHRRQRHEPEREPPPPPPPPTTTRAGTVGHTRRRNEAWAGASGVNEDAFGEYDAYDARDNREEEGEEHDAEEHDEDDEDWLMEDEEDDDDDDARGGAPLLEAQEAAAEAAAEAEEEALRDRWAGAGAVVEGEDPAVVGMVDERLVGLYKLNPADPWLESDWFQPLKLKCDIPVSKLCLKIQLVPLQLGDAGAAGRTSGGAPAPGVPGDSG